MTEPSLRQRFNLSRFALRYKKLFIALWMGISVAGILAFTSLDYALFPDVSFPVVVITAEAPLDTIIATEQELTQNLEQSLLSLRDLDELYSSTYSGQSVINVLFSGGTDLESATADVENILAQGTFPDETTWEVFPIDLNESPVITYVLLSETKTIPELNAIASQEILPILNEIPDVRRVNVLGLGEKVEGYFATRISFNGQEVLGFQVIKRSNANTLEVVKQVQQQIAELQTQLPDLNITIAETQADFIQSAVRATIDELILSVILAIIVIFAFLRNWRASLITALSIPISLLGTFIVMAIAGFSLQTLTLLALALVIGIVVDDSIVDLENIVRLIDAGESPQEAAIKGTDEISLAVTASTLTIAAVFIPVAFIGGTVGKFFKPFGLTVSAAVIFSLLVARTLAPPLAVFWLKRQAPKSTDIQPESVLVRFYRRAIKWSLHHRQIVLSIALLSLILGISIIPLIPQGFIARLDRGEFNIIYTVALPDRANSREPKTTQDTPESTNGDLEWLGNISRAPEKFLLRRTIKVGKELETAVLADPSVKSVLTIAGIRGEPNRGKLSVQLKAERQYDTITVQSQVRDRLPFFKDVTTSVEDIPFVETEAEKPLQLAILGDDLHLLKQTALQIQTQAQTIRGLVDLELSSSPEQRIERLNGQRVIYLSANLESEEGVEELLAQLEAKAKPILPPDFSLRRWGSADHGYQVLRRFATIMPISVILMLGVLLFMFGRLLEPLVVILTLPLAIFGSMLGLLITRSDFSIISLIGFIFLIGLLDKNALLLMDYANQLRANGLSREEALIETGAVRLRPILMTTVSTILGMLPIALGWGAGAELRQPMAVAIMGGLVSSSVLSLFVVPVLYTVLEDWWTKKPKVGDSNLP
ncbi:efflux RND transporter permease subunit [Gloeocapsa sp. PCC 73106]|uniref:efflux RND transporter permease subunit n=1 Tax=Gloeocapsa sp. PCC 73106 TaxID=102232 RepID=UPI0002ABDBFF|nr:efflux RND transporter permease subunit [Gloeocapsa sp. PCC 73106]ELR98926.1 cation/multidrug efflux pump [Gloeocapsa sp. PCC 73106]